MAESRLGLGTSMRRSALLFAAFLAMAALAAITGPPAAMAADPSIRAPAVAGRFYPDDPERLRGAIEAYLRDAIPSRGERPLALVAPHAGYIFSGQIAADAYKQAIGHDYDVVVILGTNHTTGGFAGVSIYPGGGYRTPLGIAEIDRQLAAQLTAKDPAFTYEPAVHRSEHSVEVQVPFVQVALPGVKIVAAIVGRPDPSLCERLGKALAEVLEGRRALIVASSDLSHYPPYEESVAADGATLRAIAAMDPAAVRDAIQREMDRGRPGLSTCACGEGPIVAAMTAAKLMGANRGVVVSYANSGDTAVGDPQSVVGYGAVVFCTGTAGADTGALRRPPVAAPGDSLGAADKRALLKLARETIGRYLRTEMTPLARGFSPVLNRRQGAFVTLNKNGQLRGCIGHMAEDAPLCRVVGAMALQAAFNDQRFAPLRPDELDAVEIEISVLTPFAKVSGPEAIVLGRDGVVLRKSGRSAVFLPQVAPEQGWDRDEMLTHLSRKAGLSGDAWRQGVEFFTFQAEVFHEADIRP
jgi:AmmeMemoRadiSam system protein B/AmmeMemoRadiSam system protein A